MNISVLDAKIKQINNESDLVEKAKQCREALDDSISIIYEYSNQTRPKKATMLELIDSQVFYAFVYDTEVIEGLHFVRKLGMNALQGRKVRKKDVNLAVDNITYFVGYVIDKVSGKDIKYTKLPYMSEAQTRRIYIDMYLEEAGWDILETDDLMQPGKAGIEIKVAGMPTDSGEGFCDYVLYGRDGRPLAIVEAKKTSVDPSIGRHQVDLYGECMKAVYGYKPVLYYTNGYVTKVIDGIYPDRRVMAFHTIDELELMIQKRDRKAISDLSINDDITNRAYQKMAITAICERLNANRRRGLLVMATGTGKTRVAISLVDILSRNHWIKNVLFLADRTSLVRQAKKNFVKYLDQSVCELSGNGEKDFTARLMFSTYQTMINYIDAEDKRFSSGRFDLIIIDEAHRSVFNKYGSIFKYFDSFLVGLTATPKSDVGKSTYELLECEQGEPCFAYSLDEAIKDKYLVGYNVINRESKILREGIKYGDLSDDDKDKLDDYFIGDDDEEVLSGKHFFKEVFNNNTCEQVVTDLMQNGLRVDDGEVIGKTIIFAYNHKHAQMIVDAFHRLYPEHGANTCQLVDYSVKFADDLVVKFGEDDDFRIAVSVDMLDTGIDVTSVLNLVFFKPVYSPIKFIQMIGRGTRLCPDIYGPGRNKSGFLIFDYCGNFEHFEHDINGNTKENATVPVSQRLYSLRTEILHELQSITYQEDEECLAYYNELKDSLHKEVMVIKSHNNRIQVREKMQYVDKYYNKDVWACLSPVNVKEIEKHISCLIDGGVNGQGIILSFDARMLKIELSILQNFNISKATNEVKIVRLCAQILLHEKASLPDVKQKSEALKKLVGEAFWANPTVMDVEYIRRETRDLMKYISSMRPEPVDIDIEDEVGASSYEPGSTAIDIRTYREKVIDYLVANSDSEVVRKIYNLEPINNDDLKKLEDILWNELGTEEEYKNTTDIDNLAAFVRSLIGLNQETVNEKFSEYISGNTFNLQQQEFVKMIINYVRENGDIELSDMVNSEPFDEYDLNSMFGEDLPKIIGIINILHNVVTAA